MTICPPGVYWIYPVGCSPYGWLVSFVSKKVIEKLVSSHVPTMEFSAETAGRIPAQIAAAARMATMLFFIVSPPENWRASLGCHARRNFFVELLSGRRAEKSRRLVGMSA